MFVGSEDFRLRGEGARWRTASFRFAAKLVDGNLGLESDGGRRSPGAPHHFSLDQFARRPY